MTLPGRRRSRTSALQPGDIGLIALAAGVLLISFAATVGVALACAWFGGGWAWPHGVAGIARLLGALLTGAPKRGLPAAAQADAPAAATVYIVVAATVVVTLAAMVLSVRWLVDLLGEGRESSGGFATRAQARRVLAARALPRRRVREIRPDLYDRHTSDGPGERPTEERGPQAPSFAARLAHHVKLARLRSAARRRDAACWPLGGGVQPAVRRLRVPYDRTTGVIGPQGSGKTLDVLAWAETTAPGGLLQTSTKVGDVLLTLPARSAAGPVVVCDPYGDLPGLPPLIWDPLAGAVSSKVAENRARAFAAGTVQGAVAAGSRDDAARFYAFEATKVLQGYFHAAALTGRTLEHVMSWVANPIHDQTAYNILLKHPHAEPRWAGFLYASLHAANHETVSNTVATVQQAMSVFMHSDLVARCIPGRGQPATDIAQLIQAGGSIYLLGKDDPYGGVSPLLTAITEDVLDTVERLGVASRYGRLAPPFMACIDEWPNLAPIPSMGQRLADWRGRGRSIVWAAQDYRAIITQYGADLAASMFAKTNVLVVFGGSKDLAFLKDLSDLLGSYEATRHTHSRGAGGSSSQYSREDRPTMHVHEIARIPARHALVVAETAPPILARMRRILDGRAGARLSTQITEWRERVTAARAVEPSLQHRTREALAAAAAQQLHVDQHAEGLP